jgi:hypothetical protein
VRGTSANVRLACTNIEDSQSLDDSKAEVRHNRERYWKLRLSRRARDTKEQDEKLSSMGCDGADEKVSFNVKDLIHIALHACERAVTDI